MNTQTIPLSNLEVSDRNARRTTTAGALEDLKASIVSHGLMQNLVVTANGGSKFYVIAGGRRLEALQALRDEGRIPAEYEVPCQVVDDANALELSLAENTVRQAMHPADEFETFSELERQGKSAAQIAERFGCTERRVLQRLKLSRVSPKILTAFRAGKLKLEQLEAFTVTEDHKKQEAVFKHLSDWDEPEDVREMLTEKMIEGHSTQAKFVGAEAYIQAGGTVRTNLFGDETYFEDPDLLRKLLDEKLAAAVEKEKADGWSWVEVEGRTDLRWRCEKLQAKKGKFTEEQKATAGCLVCITHEGKLEVLRGLVKPKDKKKGTTEKGKNTKERSVSSEQDDLSYALRQDLSRQRGEVMRLAIAKNPDIALDVLTFCAAEQLTGCGSSMALRFTFNVADPTMSDAEDSEATKELRQFSAALDLKWVDIEQDEERFLAFRKLSREQKLAILIYCVAQTVPGDLFRDGMPDPLELALGLTGLNVSDYWRPTVENYLGRLSKAQLLELTSELLGDGQAKARANDKKGEIAEDLERAFTDAAGRNDPAALKLRTWLPPGMAFPVAKQAPPAKKSKPKGKATAKAKPAKKARSAKSKKASKGKTKR